MGPKRWSDAILIFVSILVPSSLIGTETFLHGTLPSDPYKRDWKGRVSFFVSIMLLLVESCRYVDSFRGPTLSDLCPRIQHPQTPFSYKGDVLQETPPSNKEDVPHPQYLHPIGRASRQLLGADGLDGCPESQAL